MGASRIRAGGDCLFYAKYQYVPFYLIPVSNRAFVAVEIWNIPMTCYLMYLRTAKAVDDFQSSWKQTHPWFEVNVGDVQ